MDGRIEYFVCSEIKLMNIRTENWSNFLVQTTQVLRGTISAKVLSVCPFEIRKRLHVWQPCAHAGPIRRHLVDLIKTGVMFPHNT